MKSVAQEWKRLYALVRGWVEDQFKRVPKAVAPLRVKRRERIRERRALAFIVAGSMVVVLGHFKQAAATNDQGRASR